MPVPDHEKKAIDIAKTEKRRATARLYKPKIRDTAKRQRDSNNPELLVQPPSKKRKACTSLILPYQSTEYGNPRHLIPLAHTRLNATGTLLLSGFLLRSLPPRIIHITVLSQHVQISILPCLPPTISLSCPHCTHGQRLPSMPI
jgi:hypothetical protein